MTTKFILENCKNIAGWEELNPSQRSQIMFFAELVHANGVMVGKEKAVEYISDNDDISMMNEEQFEAYQDILRAARNTP